ncbi:MAG: hypothetical protein FJW27_08595 [Acidimicrobiia bacterium]|nr:hypothetical protein [Acidimicrobiia bacterium]
MTSSSNVPTVVGPAVAFAAGSVATWLAATAIAAPFGREILFAMLAPLIAAVSSWVWVARTFRRSPGRVTNVMVAAFGVKLVFFGVYVAVMLRGLALRPVPFMLGFTAYFVGLHVAEAWWLQRLFWSGGSDAQNSELNTQNS